MIKVNNRELNLGTFPDGTAALLDVPMNFLDIADSCKNINIHWHYENDGEFLTICYLVNHYRQKFGKNVTYNLYLPYVPNARMDRVKNDNEVFTLKWFAKMLNGLDFDNVYVLDPHSDVSCALIDNVHVHNADNYISDTIDDISYTDDDFKNENLVIYFPDAGAYKRYKDVIYLKKYTKVYGEKVRDWKTGQILGLKVVDEAGVEITDENALKDKTVLMIDDIISYGGTLYYSALKLKGMNPNKIYAYVTHTETNSLWNPIKGKFIELLQDKTVTKLYTTNSIYKQSIDDTVTVVWNCD